MGGFSDVLSGVGRGLERGVAVVAGEDPRGQDRQRQEKAREQQAALLESQMTGIAHNIASLPDADPRRAPLMDNLKQVSQQYRSLYQPHEAPQLIQRIQKFIGIAPKAPAPMMGTDPEAMVAAAPRPADPTAQLQRVVDSLPSLFPNATPEEMGNLKNLVLKHGLGIPPETQTPLTGRAGEPYELKDGSGWAVLERDKSGNLTERKLPANYQPPRDPADAAKAKGWQIVNNPSTGGIEGVKNLATGQILTKSNYASDPEAKRLWEDTVALQKEQNDRKLEEEKRRNEESDRRSERQAAVAEHMAQLHADIQEKSRQLTESSKIPSGVANRVSQAEIIKEQVADLQNKLKDPDIRKYMGPVVGQAGGIARLFSKKIQNFFATQESLDSLLPTLHGYRGGVQTHKVFKDAMGNLAIDPDAYQGTLDALSGLADNVINEVQAEYPNAPMFKSKKAATPGDLKGKVKAATAAVDPIEKEIQDALSKAKKK